jgi:hypothetical protein
MRLTLRTLLAYMDGMLEAADAEDIRGQIEKSEFAQNLMYRIREAVARPGLGAPEASGRKGGPDPNAVAEYLDNTLPDNRVPDFEKICLDPESDVPLAEVASCHQILTLVLGEAAEIDPDARQRMYRLPEAPSKAPPPIGMAPAAGDGDPEAQAASETAKRRPKPEVPEYLREPLKRRRLLPVVGAVALAVCFLIMVLIALGQFEPDKPLGRLFGLGGPAAETDRGGESPVTPPGEGSAGPEVTPAPDEGSTANERPAEGGPAPEIPAEPGVEPGGAATPVGPEVPPDEPVGPGEPLPGPGELPSEPAVPAAAPGGAATEPGAEPGGEPVPEMPNPPAGETPDRVEAEPGEGPGVGQEPAALVPVGRFMSEDQVLLRHGRDENVWMRVASKAPLYSGDRLVALPTYRPEIALAGVTLQLLGGTEIELLPGEAGHDAGVHVRYGRMFVLPLAQPGTRMRFVTGGHDGVLVCDDPEAIVVLEVEPVHVPGTNPESVPALLRTVLYTRSGEVTWTETAPDERVHLGPQMSLAIAGAPPRAAKPVDQFPDWVTTDTTREVDRQASTTLLKYWQAEWPASRSLVELTDFRRREVQWLATRALGYIGRFEAMVAPLDESAYWESFRSFGESADYVGELRGAVARGREAAAGVRQAFEKQYPDHAALLYRMLWGFTADGLRNGEAAVLVDHLEHETLPVRGLAFWNLRDLTGLSLYYEPEATAAERKLAVEKWRDRLASGEIWRKAAEKPQPALPPAGVAEPAAPAEPGPPAGPGAPGGPPGPLPPGPGAPVGPEEPPEQPEPAAPPAAGSPEAPQPAVPRVLGPPLRGPDPLPPPIGPEPLPPGGAEARGS